MGHSILDLLRSALVHYGYWAVAAALLLENAGLPVPGETILLLASFLAFSEHDLKLPWVMAVATIAATAGDNLGFAVGYYGGPPLLNRYRTTFRISSATIERGENLFARFGAATIFVARFLFGMRMIAGPLAGVLKMPWRKFALFNFLGAVVWVGVISSAGYLFGQHWERLVQDLKRFDIAVAAVAIVAVVAAWWRWRRAAG